MCKELVSAQLDILKAQSKYYWLPIPGKNGPEDGCTSHPIFISQEIAKNHKECITEYDDQIISATIAAELNKFDAQVNASTKSTPDPFDLALPGFTTTFGPDNSSPQAVGDVAAKNLAKLSSARSADLNKANAALQKVEIIMGEYSGLGLCDIIAIMGALYTMPTKDLLTFLDDDALDRFIAQKYNNDQETKNFLNPSRDIGDAFTVFAGYVKDFYNLIDAIYLEQSLNNNR